jgi:hypothetical protein
MSNTVSPYPEHAKQAAVLDEAQTIGQFLDEGPYILAEYVTFEGHDRPTLVPVSKSVQQILAEHLGIDLNAIEREKRQMLDAMREAQDNAEQGQGKNS